MDQRIIRCASSIPHTRGMTTSTKIAEDAKRAKYYHGNVELVLSSKVQLNQLLLRSCSPFVSEQMLRTVRVLFMQIMGKNFSTPRILLEYAHQSICLISVYLRFPLKA